MTRQSNALTLHRARWVLWLAVSLALFGALAPTVSHALQWARGGTQGGGLVEICTSTGPRWMALPTESDSAPGDPTSAAVLEHCPFCLRMADRLAPPLQPQALFFTAPGIAVVPQTPPPSYLPALIIAAAHPRGPPAF